MAKKRKSRLERLWKIEADPWVCCDVCNTVVSYGIDCPLCGKPITRFFGCEKIKDKNIFCKFCKIQFEIIDFQKFLTQVNNEIEKQSRKPIVLQIKLLEHDA